MFPLSPLVFQGHARGSCFERAAGLKNTSTDKGPIAFERGLRSEGHGSARAKPDVGRGLEPSVGSRQSDEGGAVLA